MEQKMNWMRYLSIGKGVKLLFVILLLQSCCKDCGRFYQKVDVIYVNETDKKINLGLVKAENYRKVYTLNPYSKSMVFTMAWNFAGRSGVGTCCEWVLVNLFRRNKDGRSILNLVINDALCVTHHGTGPADISNYEGKELGDEYYEFTYRFTDNDFKDMKKCE